MPEHLNRAQLDASRIIKEGQFIAAAKCLMGARLLSMKDYTKECALFLKSMTLEQAMESTPWKNMRSECDTMLGIVQSVEPPPESRRKIHFEFLTQYWHVLTAVERIINASKKISVPVDSVRNESGMRATSVRLITMDSLRPGETQLPHALYTYAAWAIKTRLQCSIDTLEKHFASLHELAKDDDALDGVYDLMYFGETDRDKRMSLSVLIPMLLLRLGERDDEDDQHKFQIVCSAYADFWEKIFPPLAHKYRLLEKHGRHLASVMRAYNEQAEKRQRPDRNLILFPWPDETMLRKYSSEQYESLLSECVEFLEINIQQLTPENDPRIPIINGAAMHFLDTLSKGGQAIETRVLERSFWEAIDDLEYRFYSDFSASDMSDVHSERYTGEISEEEQSLRRLDGDGDKPLQTPDWIIHYLDSVMQRAVEEDPHTTADTMNGQYIDAIVNHRNGSLEQRYLFYDLIDRLLLRDGNLFKDQDQYQKDRDGNFAQTRKTLEFLEEGWKDIPCIAEKYRRLRAHLPQIIELLHRFQGEEQG